MKLLPLTDLSSIGGESKRKKKRMLRYTLVPRIRAAGARFLKQHSSSSSSWSSPAFLCNFGTLSHTRAAAICFCECCNRDIGAVPIPENKEEAADLNRDFFSVLEHHHGHYLRDEFSNSVVSSAASASSPDATDDSNDVEQDDEEQIPNGDCERFSFLLLQQQQQPPPAKTDRINGIRHNAELLAASVVSYLNTSIMHHVPLAHLHLVIVQDVSDHDTFQLKARLLDHLSRTMSQEAAAAATTTTHIEKEKGEEEGKQRVVVVVFLLTCFCPMRKVRQVQSILDDLVDEFSSTAAVLQQQQQQQRGVVVDATLRVAVVCPHNSTNSLIAERTTYLIVQILSTLSQTLTERRLFFAQEIKEKMMKTRRMYCGRYLEPPPPPSSSKRTTPRISVGVLSDQRDVHTNCEVMYSSSPDFELLRVK